jgi:hypothetical protein
MGKFSSLREAIMPNYINKLILPGKNCSEGAK